MANTFNHNGKVVITDGGNVGIGTTSPTRLLEISATNPQFSIKSTSATGFSELYFGDNTADNGWIGYAHNGDYMYFGTNNSERMRITAAGNVGIGTTSPTYKLEVVGGSVNTQIARFITADYPTHSVGLGVDAQSTYWGASIFQDDVKRFTVDSTGGILVGGNYQGSDAPANGAAIEGSVGIGTTSPSYKLDVFGGFNAVTSGVNITYDNGILYHGNYYQITSGNNYLLYARGGGALLLGSDDVERIRITSAGNVGIGTTSPVSHAPSRRTLVVADTVNGANVEIWGNNAGGKSILQSVGGDTYVGNLANGSGAGTTYITSGNGSTYTTFLANGNVGIGTTSPGYKLEVNGDIGFSIGASLKWGGNTYIYGENNVQIQAVVNGNTGLFINSSGNVGIGTTAPGAPLHVYKSDTYSAIVSRADWNSSVPTKLALGKQYGVLAFISTDLVETTTDTSYIALNYKSGLTTFAEGLRVYNNGNVGIGTTSPGAKLEVTDEIRVSSGGSYASFTARNTGTTGGGGLLGYQNGVANAFFGVAGWYLGNSDTGIIVGTDSSSRPIRFYTNTERMRISGDGNVGIGTTSPSYKLHLVGGSEYIDGGLGPINSSPYTSANRLIFNNDYNDVARGPNKITLYDGSWLGGFGIHNNTLAYYSGGIHNWYLASDATNAVSLMTLTSGGSLGIGTTSPSEKLHVDGNVIVTYNNSFQGINSIGNKAILARVSPTTGIINYAEYATATNLNGFVLGSDDARVKGDIATDSLDFITNTSSRMFINSSGNVGIGTTSPSYKLDVVGDSRITSGSLGVGVAPNATDGRIDASNDIVAYSTSDQRLKENVTPIENALEKVKTLTGVEFDWKEDTAHVHGYHGHDVGIIAQDVQAVLPEAVRTNESGYLSVRYEKMIALLIEANKELAARVEFLEQKLKQ